MPQRIRAVYRNGTFVPDTTPDIPEESRVELIVESGSVVPPLVTDPAERANILRDVVENMRNNPIPAGAPRLTRADLHERR